MPFLIPFFHYGVDYMALQWCAGFLAVALFLLCPIVYRKLGLLEAIATAYIYIFSIYIFAFQWSWYAKPNINPMVQIYVHIGAGYTIFAFTCFLLYIIHGQQFTKQIFQVMPWYTVANSGYVLIGWLFGFGRLPQGVGISGFLDYSGMNAVLLACGLPFFRKSHAGYAGIALTLIAIVLSKATIPYGVVAVIALAYMIHLTRNWSSGLIAAVAVLLPTALIRQQFIFDDAYRFKAYEVFMSWWWEHSNRWLGSGPGTFQVLSPLIQVEKNFMVDVSGKSHSFFWLWLHSDILETCFEYGVLFSVLCAGIYALLLRDFYVRRDAVGRTCFSLAAGLGASAVFDYPMRYWATAFLIAFLFCVKGERSAI